MSEFRLRFFGGLALSLGEQDLTRLLSVKARGLICYLALTGRPQSRLALAGMFWGEKPEADALRSLRVDLTKMRKYIAPYIEVSRQTLAFSAKELCWIDTDAFNHYLMLAKNVDGSAARTHLRGVANLYVGDFLEGYQAGDAYGFEEWMMVQREGFRAQALSSLEKLVEFDLQHQDYEAGIETANQILNLDPWREETHRKLMWLYYQNGQRGAALRQFEICREMLDSEIGVEPEEQTIDLFHKIKQQTGADIVRTQPLTLPEVESQAVPLLMPAEIPFFCGRAAELAYLKSQFESRDGVKIVCVSGMGGVGKSSLCIQFAYQYASFFPDGVLWANANSDLVTIVERWAAAYGYNFRGISKLEDRLTAVREMLATRQALIVIDDVTVAARVKPLLPTTGQSMILATTRNADLAAALGAELFNLDVLTQENGRSLLSSIIGDFRVQNEQLAADEICQKLQNLPLALAIAGQYLVARPRRRLTDFLRRLQGTVLLDAADSEGVVRASFDISWTALDQIQQRVFALLAVFEGRAFTAAALAYIADQDFYKMQDHLDTLAARSLLIEQGEDYYRQHALLAYFSEEKLGDKRSSSLRMVDFYAGFADKFSTNYQKLNQEWDNLDAAVQIMADEGIWQTLFRFNQSLNQAWFAQGLFDRANKAYQLAYHGALSIENDGQIGENLYRQGMALLEQGQYDEARTLFEQAQVIFEDLEDSVSVADIQYELARIHIFQGRYDEADQLLTSGLKTKQTLNDLQGIGQFKYRQALLMGRAGKRERSLEILCEAAAIQEKIDSRLDLLRTLRLMLYGYSTVKQYGLAQSSGERAYALAEELGDKGEFAVSLNGLAYLNRMQKQFQLAIEYAQKSMRLLEKMGDMASLGNAKFQMCLIYRDMGEYELCLQFGQEALELFTRVSDRMGRAWVLGNMGNAYYGLNKMEMAEEYWLASKEIAQEIGNEYWVNRVGHWMSQSKTGELHEFQS
ncbi:MAG: hypothetical protein CSB13_03600 [Chloroflexi bacterium]|nr:MAG: hypothetical protein CSB13_03600 [Chloroflexota bacterium]